MPLFNPKTLEAALEAFETELNDRVYRAFDLDHDEVPLIEQEIGERY